jgi:hypothetical protein
MAFLLQTQAGAPSQTEEPFDELTPFTTLPFSRRMYVTMPQGYEAKQMTPAYPAPAYREFKREIIGEIARCENVSYSVALLDTSDSTFAGGQLDHKIYFRQHEIDRHDCGNTILDRIFSAWVQEAALLEPGRGSRSYLPQEIRQRGPDGAFALPPHSWHWDANEVGNARELAEARKTDLACGATNLAEVYARKGQDWKKALRTAARTYGVTFEELQRRIMESVFAAKQAAPVDAGAGEGGDDPAAGGKGKRSGAKVPVGAGKEN